MCRQIVCSRCNKPNWAGCGQHIEEALKNIPKEQQCQCVRQESSSSIKGSKYVLS